MKLYTYLLIYFILTISEISGTPYYEFRQRVNEYKLRSLESTNCGFWKDVLRLSQRHERYCEDGLMSVMEDFDDFEMAGISWIVSREWDNPLLSERVKNSILSRLVSTNWWLDEMMPFVPEKMQYWSENHQIGWITGQYLMGAAMNKNPDLANIILQGINNTAVFQYENGKERILRWLDFRGRFGFSEYNSDTYAPIAFDALVTVAGIAPDDDIRTLASIISFLQLYDWTLASHRGVIGSPRGRAYEGGKLLEDGPISQSIHSILWLLTGEGDREKINYSRKDCVMMILAMEAGLDIPEVLFEVGDSLKNGSYEMRERFAISSSVEEAVEEKIGFESPEDCIFWMGNGAYFSPSTARCMFIVGDAYSLWDRHPIWKQLRIALPFYHTDPYLVDAIAEAVSDIGGGPVLGRSNVYTFRTPSFMLSSTQNYHGGMTAGQQHSWQLTLDPERTRTIFTTQPTDHSYKHDQTWVGGVLPKLGQYRNTLIALYNPAFLVKLVFNTSITHAHFFREGFDEVLEADHWVIARQDNTYVALYSHQTLAWAEETSDFVGRELIAPGSENVWICHVGDQEKDGSFDYFAGTILNSNVEVSMSHKDSLEECLSSHDCLRGNLASTMECLSASGPCRLSDHLRSSSHLSRCLWEASGDLETNNFVISNIPSYTKCMKDYTNEVAVTWTLGEETFSFGWDTPFSYCGSNNETITLRDDYFSRYENNFSSTEWGDKVVNIEAGGKTLSMDLENISIVTNEI